MTGKPSIKSGVKAKRMEPEGAKPIVPIRRPNNPDIRPLTKVPEERVTMINKPNRVNANISAGPNINENLANGGDKKRSTKPETVAPKTEPTMDALKAFAAFPCCANLYPSRTVAADAAVPGMFNTIAGMDPAYTAAFQIPMRKRTPVSDGKAKVSGRRIVMAAAAVRPGIAPNINPTNTPKNMARRLIN